MQAEMFWALLTTLLPLTTAFQWTESLTNNTVMTVCSAGDIHLPWNFTLSLDDRIEDIKWIYHAENGSEELIAVYVAGQFAPMPPFSGRVRWTGQGGIVVSKAAVAESGNYTIMVSIADNTHTLVAFSRTVSVKVTSPPTAENGELHARQLFDAIYDNTTGQWVVQLTCGVFTDRGHPAVHVVWTSPGGKTVDSSSENNGTYRLLLPNPPSGGNYTCSVLPPSPAIRCLPPGSPLREGATVTVNEVKASFTLLEARQRETEARQQNMLMQMESANTRLQAELDSVKRQNSLLQKTTASLEARLATATLRVSFHAMLASTFTGIGTLKPFTVITNDGGAFNGTSGIFTAPRNGTFFFLASAGTDRSDNVVWMSLQKDGQAVSVAFTRQSSVYQTMGSVHATLDLTAGQCIWVQSDEAQGYCSNHSTSFTGFLIRADD
ncbi:uncharacterized protein [Littorina saxatilis]|uniref:Uncharacterized protein n=1 Tax=Littorina saxatilis TaxID=31220 RepID=A0AAN9GK26_9CAEN